MWFCDSSTLPPNPSGPYGRNIHSKVHDSPVSHRNHLCIFTGPQAPGDSMRRHVTCAPSCQSGFFLVEVALLIHSKVDTAQNSEEMTGCSEPQTLSAVIHQPNLKFQGCIFFYNFITISTSLKMSH